MFTKLSPASLQSCHPLGTDSQAPWAPQPSWVIVSVSKGRRDFDRAGLATARRPQHAGLFSSAQSHRSHASHGARHRGGVEAGPGCGLWGQLPGNLPRFQRRRELPAGGTRPGASEGACRLTEACSLCAVSSRVLRRGHRRAGRLSAPLPRGSREPGESPLWSGQGSVRAGRRRRRHQLSCCDTVVQVTAPSPLSSLSPSVLRGTRPVTRRSWLV